jgi:purine-binding chemotaxis protein CheW
MEPRATDTSEATSAARDPEQSWLAFMVAGVSLVVTPSVVHEICDLGMITPLPLAPRYLEGIVSMRGRPVPLVALAVFANLRLEPRKARRENPERCLVVTASAMTVAIRCDEIRGVLSSTNLVRPPSVALPTGLGPFVKGEVELGDDLYLVFDVTSFIDSARLRA